MYVCNVCMYVCMHACMHACMYVCMYVCMCCTYVFMYHSACFNNMFPLKLMIVFNFLSRMRPATCLAGKVRILGMVG